ncbi:hypothetical protein SNEBB_006729 [Seison nebaliae]|nr:hypothetical protein SNEBB_006729 [Seison nebaliae]
MAANKFLEVKPILLWSFSKPQDIQSVEIDDHLIFSCKYNIQFLNGNDGRITKKIKNAPDGIFNLTMSNDGKYISWNDAAFPTNLYLQGTNGKSVIKIHEVALFGLSSISICPGEKVVCCATKPPETVIRIFNYSSNDKIFEFDLGEENLIFCSCNPFNWKSVLVVTSTEIYMLNIQISEEGNSPTKIDFIMPNSSKEKFEKYDYCNKNKMSNDDNRNVPMAVAGMIEDTEKVERNLGLKRYVVPKFVNYLDMNRALVICEDNEILLLNLLNHKVKVLHDPTSTPFCSQIDLSIIYFLPTLDSKIYLIYENGDVQLVMIKKNVIEIGNFKRMKVNAEKLAIGATKLYILSKKNELSYISKNGQGSEISEIQKFYDTPIIFLSSLNEETEQYFLTVRRNGLVEIANNIDGIVISDFLLPNNNITTAQLGHRTNVLVCGTFSGELFLYSIASKKPSVFLSHFHLCDASIIRLTYAPLAQILIALTTDRLFILRVCDPPENHTTGTSCHFKIVGHIKTIGFPLDIDCVVRFLKNSLTKTYEESSVRLIIGYNIQERFNSDVDTDKYIEESFGPLKKDLKQSMINVVQISEFNTAYLFTHMTESGESPIYQSLDMTLLTKAHGYLAVSTNYSFIPKCATKIRFIDPNTIVALGINALYRIKLPEELNLAKKLKPVKKKNKPKERNIEDDRHSLSSQSVSSKHSYVKPVTAEQPPSTVETLLKTEDSPDTDLIELNDDDETGLDVFDETEILAEQIKRDRRRRKKATAVTGRKPSRRALDDTHTQSDKSNHLDVLSTKRQPVPFRRKKLVITEDFIKIQLLFKNLNIRVTRLDIAETLPSHIFLGNDLQFNSERVTMISGGADGYIHIRLSNQPELEIVHVMNPAIENCRFVYISPKMKYLYFVGDDQTYGIVELKYVETIRMFSEQMAIPIPDESRINCNDPTESAEIYGDKSMTPYYGESTIISKPWYEAYLETAKSIEKEKYSDAREGIMVSLDEIRKELDVLLEANRQKENPIAQLELHEFELNIEEETKIKDENEKEIKEMVEEYNNQIAKDIFVRDMIKAECWDGLNTKVKGLAPFLHGQKLNNFPLFAEEANERELRKKLIFQRKVEIYERNLVKNYYHMKTHEELEFEFNLNSQNDWYFYPQLQLTAKHCKMKQIILLKHQIREYMKKFNKKFEEMTGRKEVEKSRIEQKQGQIRQILKDISLLPPIRITELASQFFEGQIDKELFNRMDEDFDDNSRKPIALGNLLEPLEMMPETNDDRIVFERTSFFVEHPETMFVVLKQDIKSKQYLTEQQLQELEQLRLARLEEIKRNKADNWRKRGLMDMMHGVLEIRPQDELRKKVDVPKCLLEGKQELYFSAEERTQVMSYVKKTLKLNDDREKMNNSLRKEKREIINQLMIDCDIFDTDLAKLHNERVEVSQKCYSAELFIVRLLYSIMCVEELNWRIEQLKNLIEESIEEKRQISQLIIDGNGAFDHLKEQHNELQLEMKEIDRSFQKELHDLKPPLKETMMHQYNLRGGIKNQETIEDNPSNIALLENENLQNLFKSLKIIITRRKTEVYQRLTDMNLPANKPDGCDLYIWDQLVKYRQERLDLEDKCDHIKIMIIEIMHDVHRHSSKQQLISEKHNKFIEQLANVKAVKRQHSFDFEIQFEMRQGRIEITTESDTLRSESSCLLERHRIEELNAVVKEIGNQILSKMNDKMETLKRLKQIEWTNDKLEMRVQDLRKREHDITFFKVTNETRKYLENIQKYDAMKEKELVQLEKTLEVQQSIEKKKRKELEQEKSKIGMSIESLRKTNTNLEKTIKDYNITLSEKKRPVGTLAKKDKLEMAQQKFKQISEKRGLEELARLQAQEIEFLQNEVEKLPLLLLKTKVSAVKISFGNIGQCKWVNCFEDPCKFSFCDISGAMCYSNYCNGCNAEWFSLAGNKLDCNND